MDNKSMTGPTDRSRISGGQPWEMQYITRKFSVSQEKVKRAIEEVGNSRIKVEQFIRRSQMK